VPPEMPIPLRRFLPPDLAPHPHELSFFSSFCYISLSRSLSLSVCVFAQWILHLAFQGSMLANLEQTQAQALQDKQQQLKTGQVGLGVELKHQEMPLEKNTSTAGPAQATQSTVYMCSHILFHDVPFDSICNTLVR
jgi:hypothetical protein